MEKRYQVFISSTKFDLESIRSGISLALLNEKYIPVGMEQWGATPMDSWSLIKKFIDQCDYYVLIIGGLYGSINKETGLSFTESEYDYAVEKKIPVFAFLHKNIKTLSGAKVESSAKRRRMLESFRKKVEDWSVSFWEDEKQLLTLIPSKLNKTVGDFDRPGWIPGNSVPENLQHELEAILYPCRRQGIARVVPDGKVDSNVMTSNLEVSKEIRIMVTSGTRFLDAYRRAISKAIAGGANLRLLLPKPESDFIKDVGESEREGKEGKTRQEELVQEIKEVRPRVLDYFTEAKRSKNPSHSRMGTISIGYYTTHLRSTIILCDDSWGWLTITLPPFKASETLSLELHQTGSECFLSDCIRHFDRTWEIIESRNDVQRL
ncbi:MAG: DUF4062 domain-containing protein [Pyrinomonadaceae bacterium]